MKHLFPILIILLTLASCTNKTRQEIEGVWLGYERTSVLNNDTTDDDFHLILSIDKDSIQALNFKFITSGNRDSISNSSYILSGNSLIVARNSESDTFGIDVLNETTLVLSKSKNKFIYTKLRKALTKEWNFDFVGKAFTISDSSTIIDTIEFLDSSTLLTYNSELERPTQTFEWRVRDYSGYKFLIIDSPEIPVFLLVEDVGNNFKLKREPNDQLNYHLKIIEFETKFNRDELIGEWIGKSNKPDNNLSFIFDSDSLKMNDITGGKMIKSNYTLTLSGERILFYNYIIQNFMLYRINSINEESLSLTRISKIKDTFNLMKNK